MTDLTDLKGLYERRATAAARDGEVLDRRGRLVSNLRGVSFATLAIGLGYGLAEGSWLALGIGAVGVVAFAILVSYHDRVFKLQEDARRRELVNRHALSRVLGTWRDLPQNGSAFVQADHPYAEDLDLFGPGSLFQRMSVAHTRYGAARLASWLSEPAAPDEIRARQQAVVELKEQLDFRQGLEAEGMALVEKRRGDRIVVETGPDPSELLRWVASREDLPGGPLVTVLSFVIPLATTLGIFAQIELGTSPLGWLVPLLSGLALLAWTKNATSAAFAAVSTTEGAFLRYGALLENLENLEVSAPWLEARKRSLFSQETNRARPSQVMRKFRSLVGWYDLRHNGMVYPFINAFLLWDIHCTRALHRWREGTGANLERWFDVIGEFEAISSFAGFHYDEPNSTLPDVNAKSDEMVLAGQAVGHPLIAAAERVENEVDGFGPGQALLVTGSNMSGKSTFLRALGVNLVLALAGAPVCSRSMRVPHCAIGTSIRISDSLSSGVSHFYREVQKLAAIVERSQGRQPVFFLLDEILHGTNSRERRIGARWVLKELLSKGAFGVVTTHDMELCRLPHYLMQQVRQHHFRESVEGNEMTFDYTLREGPVRSGNALRLMQLVGLDVPLEESEASPLPGGSAPPNKSPEAADDPDSSKIHGTMRAE